MQTKYTRGGLFSILLTISITAARQYPIQEVTINNCIPEQEICTQKLPRIVDANYELYKNNPVYRRIYTVLRGATYIGQRDQGLGSHKGVDIATIPKTPVYAIQDGTVIEASWRGNRGNVIVIEHTYNNTTIHSSYAHMGAMFVKKGDAILAGQNIGEVGDSGNTSGPHLHFQIDTNQDGKYPFHFYNCPGTLEDIVNQGLCRNQLLANTIDPIVFLEEQIKNTQQTSNHTIQFNNFIGGYTQLNAMQFLTIKNTNLETTTAPITIKFDTDKVWIFPDTIDFLGSQRTIYMRGLQTGFTTIDLIQDNIIVKRIPLIVGEESSFRIDNKTITTVFEKIPLQ